MVRELPFLDRLPNNWKPRSKAQLAALKCPAQVLMYGGAAGSLKSTTVLVDALKYYQRPHYNGIIFRKSHPEMLFLIDRTRELYSQTGGMFYEGDKEWRWPWGATIKFRHLEQHKDVFKHQGPEYQYVAFDESTHQPEDGIRFILNSRMRSVDGIPMRMRLATNPGNIGHAWHMNLFLGGICPHCVIESAKVAGTEPMWPDGARLPYHIYNDAVWPSDKISIQHSTCFIPGRVDDHDLFGANGGEYAKKLRGLPEALMKAMLEGCWAAFEGQFFDCFNLAEHVVARGALNDMILDWWPYWVGIDYGFAHATCAYLCTKSPEGKIYILDEYVARRRKAVDVARDLRLTWGHHNPKAWYLSPDAGRHDGTEDMSRKEQMIAATGIGFEDAYNERVGGAMLMYTLFAEGKLQVADNCKLLIKSIQTRVHGERDPEDVEKDKTAIEDDAYDAARYAIASHISPGKEPEIEQLRRAAKTWSQDPTEAMMQYLKWMDKNKPAQSQTYYPRARCR